MKRRRTTRTMAHGHSQHAVHHEGEGAKLHAEQCASLVMPTSAKADQQKSAA